MLGIQLNFSGDKLVVCNNVVVGMLADDNTEDCLGVLRILGNEYAEQVRLIKTGLLAHKKELDWLISVQLWSGELVISVRYGPLDFRELVEKYCYPMKVDNLTITYVKCKKAYTIRQSAVYAKYELKKLGVIK